MINSLYSTANDALTASLVADEIQDFTFIPLLSSDSQSLAPFAVVKAKDAKFLEKLKEGSLQHRRLLWADLPRVRGPREDVRVAKSFAAEFAEKAKKNPAPDMSVAVAHTDTFYLALVHYLRQALAGGEASAEFDRYVFDEVFKISNGAYEPLESYNKGHLAVSGGHRVYYEESGNPAGIPIVMVHGGPGAGMNPFQRRLADPAKYRIIQFDQRGCGKSEPNINQNVTAALEGNTIWNLVEDMEALRQHLGVAQWMVAGHSWGVILGLAYAVAYPQRVSEMIYRGVCTGNEEEIQWIYEGGAGRLRPKEWERFVNFLPEAGRNDPLTSYGQRLFNDDPDVYRPAAEEWTLWEMSIANLYVDPKMLERVEDPEFARPFALLEHHYYAHGPVFGEDDYLWDRLHLLRGIPTAIVHGRYDIICPVTNAQRLKNGLGDRAVLQIVEDAGHSITDSGNSRAFVQFTDRYAQSGSFI